MKAKKLKKVEKAFRKLLKKGNKITTLGVKNNLRHNYPNKCWKQKDISKALIDIEANDKNISFTDNGTYREYSIVAYNTSGAIKKPKLKTKLRDGGKISKTDAVTKIKSSKGRFFTVTFIKKDKSERVLNGNIRLDNFMNNQGYINVKESNGNTRQVNPRTITALKIAGSQYIVK